MRALLRAVPGFVRASTPRKRLALESFVLLAVARVIVFSFPFRWIAHFLEVPFGARPVSETRAAGIRANVVWALQRASNVLPGSSSCFAIGIAAHLMCRRRGVRTTFYYGVAIAPGEPLKAHVWISHGFVGVVGHTVANAYHVLSRFPSEGDVG